jgi:hypothetical protein
MDDSKRSNLVKYALHVAIAINYMWRGCRDAKHIAGDASVRAQVLVGLRGLELVRVGGGSWLSADDADVLVSDLWPCFFWIRFGTFKSSLIDAQECRWTRLPWCEEPVAAL